MCDLKCRLAEINRSPMAVRCLALLVFLVGIHSLLLGVFIFCFTEPFYRFFFHAEIDNFFYIRQSGLFLVCLGFFYLSPLLNLAEKHRLITVVILTKVLAVLFLVTHARYVPWPPMVYLAAAADGGMAALLLASYCWARSCLTAG